jgi:putative serine protease PepD
VIDAGILKRGAGLVGAAVLGGAVALAGAALVGGSDRPTTTVRELVQTPSSGRSAASFEHRGKALTINEVYRQSAPGVVQVTATTAVTPSVPTFFNNPFSPQQQLQRAEGSGFVWDKAGHIVTNYHVVQGAKAVEVSFSNQDTLKARIVGVDQSTDVAVLKVATRARALTPLALGNSDDVRVGDSVVAIGNPFGLDRSVTAGIVSALQREITSPNDYAIDHVIQTDAAINHGNSGGPLLNLLGEVIGVNAQIASDSGGNNGVGFAIPSNTVRSAVTQLLANGTVKHAYLGVTVGTSTQVGSVPSGTPAAKAGLRAGDVITALDSKPVGTGAELRSVINGKHPGDSISVTYTRGGSSHTVQLTLASRPK